MYASPIWSPHVAVDQYRLETVQHKFLRYLSFKNGQAMDPFSHDYSNIMSLYSVPTLKSYRDLRDVLFAFKIINECIDCDTLCKLFKRRQLPYELRNPRLFKEERFNANYTSYSTIPRLIKAWHDLPSSIVSVTEANVFKKLVKQEILKYK